MFTASQQDALQELVNIGVGRAAATLNRRCGAHVSLMVPKLTVMAPEDVRARFFSDDGQLTAVQSEFRGPFGGAAALVFPTLDANRLVTVLSQDEDDCEELDPEESEDLRIGTLVEVGNIVINSVVGAINNLLNSHMEFRVPEFREGSIADILTASGSTAGRLAIVAHTGFRIDTHDVDGNLLMTYETATFESLLDSLEFGELA